MTATDPAPTVDCSIGHWFRRDREGLRVWICVRCGTRQLFNLDGPDELDLRIRSLQAERQRLVPPPPRMLHTEPRQAVDD